MKWLLGAAATGFFLGVLLGLALCAEAADLSWDPSAGATGYEIERSLDQGATWALVGDVTASVCTGTPARCAYSVTPPVSGYALYRFSAKNAAGKAIRYNAGTWLCESCNPPAQPTSVGVK